MMMMMMMGGDYFEVMTLKVDQKSMSTQPLWFKLPFSPTRWDLSRLFRICRFLTRFLFGVWDPLLLDQISLPGGISPIYIE